MNTYLDHTLNEMSSTVDTHQNPINHKKFINLISKTRTNVFMSPKIDDGFKFDQNIIKTSQKFLPTITPYNCKSKLKKEN
jgi:hypothetical protein